MLLPFVAPVAQVDVRERARRTHVASLDIESVEVRTVLRKLFREHLFGATIAPDVEGTITLSLRKVDYETVVENVLRKVDATYRVEDGVYFVVPGRIPAIPCTIRL